MFLSSSRHKVRINQSTTEEIQNPATNHQNEFNIVNETQLCLQMHPSNPLPIESSHSMVSRAPTTPVTGSTSRTVPENSSPTLRLALSVLRNPNVPDLSLEMLRNPHSLKRRSFTMSLLSARVASAVPSQESSVATLSRHCSSNPPTMFPRVLPRATPVLYMLGTMTSLEVSMPSSAGPAIKCFLNWIVSYALDIS